MRKDSDYILVFDAIENSNGSVHFFDREKGIKRTITITINDKEFSYRAIKDFPEIIADLIDVAVAIYASDRLVPQKQSEKQCRIRVVIPVRCPDRLNTERNREVLENLLQWATGSRWEFIFKKRNSLGRFSEQPSLPIAPQKCEVVLWSGGLDALAGLYTRLKKYPERQFVLFGTGGSTFVYSHQKKVAQAILDSFPNRCNLYRLSICLSGSKTLRKNKIPRARGVVFILLGSACAYLMGCRELSIYENGIGAINLPYRKSAVGLDHTRSVHPKTLAFASEFITNLLQEKFFVRNPFLFWIKAEMCKALSEDEKFELPPLTKSCDSPHRSKPIQCGYCSSCILRKQALAASKIKDKTLYVVPHGKRPVENTTLYFLHMLTQVSTIRELLNTACTTVTQWEYLTRRFPELNEVLDQLAATEDRLIPNDIQRRLIRLYKAYVDDWEIVESKIAEDFLS